MKYINGFNIRQRIVELDVIYFATTKDRVERGITHNKTQREAERPTERWANRINKIAVTNWQQVIMSK